MSQLGGRAYTRSAMASLLPGEQALSPLRLADLFGPELDQYAEVIVGPHQRPAGFMTRGEDATFTERAQHVLAQMKMPEAARVHHRVLADWFEHVRAFLKLEWHAGSRGLEPLVACYFRRRPSVDDVLNRFAHWGVGPAARELLMDVAGALEKDSVHFVSAAFRPECPVHHKLYFSQWVTAETREQVGARIAQVFRLFNFPAEVQASWRRNHERSVQLPDSTLFLSLSFAGADCSPSFKIDYPRIGPARAAVWVPAAEQPQVMADAEGACALVGIPALSYLGVRFRAGEPLPSLKYYCDVPIP
jgi:hypothetical protein